MTLLVLAVGLALLLTCFLVFLLVLPKPSAGSIRLEEVTRESYRASSGNDLQSWRSLITVDQLAKPITLFRSLSSAEPDQELTRRLMLAGYRKPAHADMFLGARLALPALLGVIVALTITESTIVFFLLALIIGFFLPDFWLSHAINKRRERLRLSLPDGLDLLSICMEAGLGLDQSIVRVGQELHVSHPELSEEFLQMNFEQLAGATRMSAWKSFADRADVESVRSFVAMLIQTDRFGTPVAKSLASFSDALRTQRRQQAEERAAKTTIKLVPPLVFLIFPDVFIVTVGPAVLTVMKSIGHLVG
jgi:tight adherence protein C